MRVLLLLPLLLLGGHALAERVWVDDALLISLRTGQGNAYKILRTLPSGTPLEVLERGPEYCLVKTEGGIEGWVRTQYLVDQPIARDRLVAAEAKIGRLEARSAELRHSIDTLQGEKRTLTGERDTLRRENATMRDELENLRQVAARPLALQQENKTMRERIGALEQEAKALEEQTTELRNSAYRDWFITGASVLFVGVLLGLILPRLRRKRAGGWGGDL